MAEFMKTTPDSAVPQVTPLEGSSCSCFVCDCPSMDSVIAMGTKVMAVKDLEAEMAAGTPFGLKLREIVKKVEAL